jgi:predicted component of type VI protein secretion system
MREDNRFFQINLDVTAGREPHVPDEPSSDAELVFRLAICGDFTGRSGSTGEPPRAPAAWRVDRDDFDEVLESLAQTLRSWAPPWSPG